LHELYDKHYAEQAALVDQLAERIQLLGGVSVAMAADVAELTRIERPPIGREAVPCRFPGSWWPTGLVASVSPCPEQAQENGDDGTNDLLVSSIRTNGFRFGFCQRPVPTELIENQPRSVDQGRKG
jgi:starvation-inducible DNA-binding protein